MTFAKEQVKCKSCGKNNKLKSREFTLTTEHPYEAAEWAKDLKHIKAKYPEKIQQYFQKYKTQHKRGFYKWDL